VVVGSVGNRLYMRHTFEKMVSGSKDHMERTAMARLTRRLDLTSAEQERVRPILDEAAGELHRLRVEQRPQVEAIVDRAAERMKAELPPDKGRKLDEAVARFKARGPRPEPVQGKE
jgi:hypothetical protein